MKRLLTVIAITISMMSISSESKAQSSLMGPSMTVHTDYKGAYRSFQRSWLGEGLTILWTCMSIAGPGSGDFNQPRIVFGRLHVPIDCIIYDEDDNDVTWMFQDEIEPEF